MPTKRTPIRNAFDTLIPDRQPGQDLEGARLVPVELIDHNPAQFRQSFNPETIRELANSIAEQGLIEPLIVRPRPGDRFEVVAGERRLRALRLLQEERNQQAPDAVAVIVRQLDDAAAALIIATENLQREDLSVVDEAVMYERLIGILELDPDRGNSQLGRHLGIDANRIQRIRRLARYPSILSEVAAGALTLRQGLERASAVERGDAEEPASGGASHVAVTRDELEQMSEMRHGDAFSTKVENSAPDAPPAAMFSEQHVQAYTRRVPAAALKPWLAARTNFSKFAEQRDRVLLNLPPTELDILEREAEEVRQQAEETLAAIRQRRSNQ